MEPITNLLLSNSMDYVHIAQLSSQV